MIVPAAMASTADETAPTDHRVLIGVEIGGTKLQVVAGDASGRIHARERFAVDP